MAGAELETGRVPGAGGAGHRRGHLAGAAAEDVARDPGRHIDARQPGPARARRFADRRPKPRPVSAAKPGPGPRRNIPARSDHHVRPAGAATVEPADSDTDAHSDADADALALALADADAHPVSEPHADSDPRALPNPNAPPAHTADADALAGLIS